MKRITNPLTIVAIFSGLAEVAGTVVLPQIASELQNILIWYVMGFPVLLVVAFFLTWNFNSGVLYSPSDFKNEEKFMEYTISKIRGKVKEEVEEKKVEKEAGEKLKNIIDTLEKDLMKL